MSAAQSVSGRPLSFVTDANVNLHIVTGLRRRLPSVDIITARQVGLLALSDPHLLDAPNHSPHSIGRTNGDVPV